MNDNSSEITGYYQEQYQNHQVHSILDSLLDEVRDNEPPDIADAGVQPRAAYYRLIEVLSWSQALLSEIDPLFIHKASLNNLVGNLNNIKQLWTNFRNDLNHWNALEQQIESFIANLQQITKNHIDSSKLSNLFEEYYQKCIALKRNATIAEQEIESAKKKTDSLSKEIENQKALLNKISTDHTEKFTNAQSQRAEEFSQYQTERNKKVNEFIEGKDKEIDAKLEELENRFDEFQEEKTQLAASMLKEINKKLIEAKEVVGTIVTSTMMGNYQIIAQREYKSAWAMRILALLSFVGMVLVLFALVNHLAQNESINWAVSVIRLVIGLVLIGPATYCAKESSRHWKLEKEYRRMALELSAIEPFIDRIEDPAIKKKLLEKKADAYFGTQQFISEDDKDELESTRLSLSTIVEFIKQIANSISNKG